MNMNQIDPALIAQAQMLGQHRTPTRSEQREMEQQGIMMAILSVAGTSLSSILEGGSTLEFEEAREIAMDVAKGILRKSEETKDDFGEDVMKRKIRNQLAAQLIYSSLRGYGTANDDSDKIDNLINRMFKMATKIVEDSLAFAKEEVEREEPISSTIELATS